MTKVVVQPYDRYVPSKRRNSKSRALVPVDASGKEIKGNAFKHFNQAREKQLARYNAKTEEYKKLSEEQIKELYTNPKKPDVSGNTDKTALEEVYTSILIERWKDLDRAELLAITGSNKLETAVLSSLYKKASEKE